LRLEVSLTFRLFLNSCDKMKVLVPLAVSTILASCLCGTTFSKGWYWFNLRPFIYSHSSNSWFFIKVVNKDFSLYDYKNKNWITLIDSPNYSDGYSVGIETVKSNPSSFSLYNQEYLNSSVNSNYDLGYSSGVSALSSVNQNGFAPTSMTSKELLAVESGGMITKFTFLNQYSGTYSDATGSGSIMYFYDKVGDNIASYTINSDSQIVTGTLTFSSSIGGSFTKSAKDIITNQAISTSSGTFTISL